MSCIVCIFNIGPFGSFTHSVNDEKNQNMLCPKISLKSGINGR